MRGCLRRPSEAEKPHQQQQSGEVLWAAESSGDLVMCSRRLGKAGLASPRHHTPGHRAQHSAGSPSGAWLLVQGGDEWLTSVWCRSP